MQEDQFVVDPETAKAFLEIRGAFDYMDTVRDAVAVIAGYIVRTHHRELGEELAQSLLKSLQDNAEGGMVMEWMEDTLEGMSFAKNRKFMAHMQRFFDVVREEP